MINPEYKPHWRPTHDLGRRFVVQAVTESYTPTDAADACAFVRELAFPDISAYDGQACQAEMVEDKARELFPEVFDQTVVVAPQPITHEPSPVSDFYAKHRYENGDINWKSVVRATSYVVSSTVIAPPLTEQLDEIALTA